MIVKIDLDNESRVPVELSFEWTVSLPAPKKLSFFDKLKGKKQDQPVLPLVVYVTREEKTLDGPEKKINDLVLTSSDLVYIDLKKGTDDGERPVIARVDMTADQAPFRLMFDTKAIMDCTSGAEHKKLRYKLLVYDGNQIYGDKLTPDMFEKLIPLRQEPVIIDLDIPKVTPKLKGFLNVVEDLTYNLRDGIVEIGDARIIAECGDQAKSKSERVPIQHRQDVELDISYILEGPNRRPIQGALVVTDKEEDEVLFVQGLALDMSKIKNPKNAEDNYTIKMLCKYRPKGSDAPFRTLDVESKVIQVFRDNVRATLGVRLDKDIIRTRNEAGDVVEKTRIPLSTFNFRLEGDMTRRYSCVIGNISGDNSVEGAGVQVSRLRVDVNVEGTRLFDSSGREIDPNTLFEIADDQYTRLMSAEGVFMPNGFTEGSEIILPFVFNPTKIARIEWRTRNFYEMTVVCNVSMDYTEYCNGVNASAQADYLRFCLVQPAFLTPNPEWLCIDYGSSAIVSIFESKVLDLHKRKRDIISADPQYKTLTTDTLEAVDSPFLSSDILLLSVKKKEVKVDPDGNVKNPPMSSLSTQRRDLGNYSDLSVCLSPTSSMITANYTTQVPCLKMLVGRRYLPANNNYDVKYYYKRDSEVVHSEDSPVGQNDDNSLKPVINVLRESYHTLFQYFIAPSIDKVESVNRLVLTYPNTYTPLHLSMIREIVSKNFPYIRTDRECLQFVSESDAVAAYYLRHWAEYHAPGADMRIDEAILVYDMGAGTLDISLIQKRFVDGRYTMDIVGKFGSCKAGNYLDFVLAQIVTALTGINSEIASTEEMAMGVNDRTQMKFVVKSIIKPALSDTNIDKIDFKFGGRNYSIKRSDVLQHKLFVQYLDEVTGEMMDLLCKYMGVDRLHLTTVLLSGRSARLAPLQLKLKVAISDHNVGDCNYIALDSPINPQENVKDRQKLAVAQGAMTVVRNYRRNESNVTVHSKRLYANYGIAYQRQDGTWRYVELLSHRDVPTTLGNGEHHFPLKSIDDVGSGTDLKFVQTYLSERETIDGLTSERTDYITVMSSYDYDEYCAELKGGTRLDVGIVLDKNDSVALVIGAQQSISKNPKESDLESDVAKRSFWPVMISFNS